MSAHLDDEAELYPLGLLDDEERSRVELHVASCDVCARRVQQAEAAALSLASQLSDAAPSERLKHRISGIAYGTRRPPAFEQRFALAAAAVVALCILALGWQTLSLRSHVSEQSTIMAAIVHSHFNHVAMTPLSAQPVSAKILYARDRSWIYIVADKPGGALVASAQTPAGERDLGDLSSAGDSAWLFVRPRETILSVRLVRDGTVVAKVTFLR